MFVRTKDGKIFDCYVSEQMGKPIYYPKRSKLMVILIGMKYIRSLKILLIF